MCIKPVSVCLAQLCEAAVCVQNSETPQRLRVHLITRVNQQTSCRFTFELWTRSVSLVFMLNCANFALESKGNDILGGFLTFLACL